MRIEPAARVVAVALLFAQPAVVGAQDAGAGADEETPAGDGTGVHFASFDVGIGGVGPENAAAGLSYGVGFDLANLPARGLSARFGFRFWSASDEAAGVDIDDGLFELLVKAHLGSGSLRGYVGAGFGAHFVSARLAETPEVPDARDGFRPGLQLLLGAEAGLGADRFLAVFVEGVGSLVSEPRHAMAHAGVRVRFDRLGGR
ncbi:MAG: hypothetical protein ACOC9N_00220 [Gemmatimonadota bacterium]